MLTLNLARKFYFQKYVCDERCRGGGGGGGGGEWGVGDVVTSNTMASKVLSDRELVTNYCNYDTLNFIWTM